MNEVHDEWLFDPLDCPGARDEVKDGRYPDRQSVRFGRHSRMIDLTERWEGVKDGWVEIVIELRQGTEVEIGERTEAFESSEPCMVPRNVGGICPDRWPWFDVRSARWLSRRSRFRIARGINGIS